VPTPDIRGKTGSSAFCARLCVCVVDSFGAPAKPSAASGSRLIDCRDIQLVWSRGRPLCSAKIPRTCSTSTVPLAINRSSSADLSAL